MINLEIFHLVYFTAYSDEDPVEYDCTSKKNNGGVPFLMCQYAITAGNKVLEYQLPKLPCQAGNWRQFRINEMKMRALFLFVISTILTFSWTKKYFLVETVDKKDETEASLPPEDSKLPPEDTKLPPEDSKLPREDTKLPPEDSKLPPDNSKLPPEDDSIPAKSDYQHHGMSIAEILGVQNSGLWWVKEKKKKWVK